MAPSLLLGILTWRKGKHIEELRFFSDLAKEASLLKTEVFLFSPQDVLSSQRVHGLAYLGEKGWKPGIFPFPDMVYDRFRNMSPGPFKQFVQFRNRTSMSFLNSRLAHKWNVHRYLSGHSAISKWLPETLMANQTDEVFLLLEKYPSVYLKPVNGTGGKGILWIRRNNNHYLVWGRDPNRKKVKWTGSSRQLLRSFLSRWMHGHRYIVQQGLELELSPGLVSDFRLLVQKDGEGKWTITGLGAKIGSRGSATSNLHGGGKAARPEQVLKPRFPKEKRLAIYEECHKLGLSVASYLEEKFGRLAELGIDIGIDKNGRIWLIEVNPKPGRDIFRKMGDYPTYRRAVRNPILYALFLCKPNKDG